VRQFVGFHGFALRVASNGAHFQHSRSGRGSGTPIAIKCFDGRIVKLRRRFMHSQSHREPQTTGADMSDSKRSGGKASNSRGGAQRDDQAEGESVANQASELLSKVTDGTKDLAQRTASTVRDGYERASRGATAAYETGVEWEAQLEKYIRRNPMMSVMIAAGGSLLLGMLIGRATATPPRPRHWWNRYMHN
jgi:ElaB/YqjD/DUF883 family membrane-anchored ribosome-binding protein